MTKTEITAAIRRRALELAMDAEFALRQCEAESGFDPKARSSCGALGLFQLMPATAAELRVDPLDPVQNIDGGLRYMKTLLAAFRGDRAKALAAYNWGRGHVDQTVRTYGAAWLSHAPAETQHYVARILFGNTA